LQSSLSFIRRQSTLLWQLFALFRVFRFCYSPPARLEESETYSSARQLLKTVYRTLALGDAFTAVLRISSIAKEWVTMRINKALQRGMLVLACVGMIIPRSCLLAQQPTKSTITDVALDAQGIFQGRVVDAQGQPVTGINVLMKTDEAVVVSTQTDAAGAFQVNSLRGGFYQLHVASSAKNVRVWAPSTAPPSATEGLLVTLGDVQRGQGCTVDSCTGTCGGTCAACGGGGALGFFTHPFVIGAAVAAAIAIPLAVSNNDDDDDAS
jgi:hypothetical protein